MGKSGKKPLTARKKNVVKLERPARNWNNSTYRQLQRDFIIENSKDVKYTFYDHYLNDENREYFKKPIGLYDPLGENVNPYTLKPYENFYENDLPKKYTFGPLQGKDYGYDYQSLSYLWTNNVMYKKYYSKMIDVFRENQVVVLTAGTGVGKTVIAPRAAIQAFNYQKRVICCIPKTKPCREAAEYAAKCASVRLGEEIGMFFGGANQVSNKTMLTFCTTGALLSKAANDAYFEEYDVVIVDEAHERQVQTDLLLLYLKKALVKRKDLKVIIMSATIDKDLFLNYFPNGNSNKNSENNIEKAKFKTVHLDVPSEEKLFNVEVFYEKNPISSMEWKKKAADKIAELLINTTEGDIITFVGSAPEGRQICNDIRAKMKGHEGVVPFCVDLHGSSSTEEVDYAKGALNYHEHPESDPSNPYTRKLIFATNAVESSLTIPTIVYVVDSGYQFEQSYSPEDDANCLIPDRISQASANQRKGRAGRTQNGYCYRLYTEEEFNQFREYAIPEIQKTDLSTYLLDMMRLPYISNVGDVEDKILKYLIEPPFQSFIKSGIHKLFGLSAIDKEEKEGKMTELGSALTKFRQVDLNFAKAMIASYYLQCKNEVMDIYAMYEDLDGRMSDVFDEPRSKKGMNNYEVELKKREFEKKKKSFYSAYGDFITISEIYQEYKNFLRSSNTLTKEDAFTWLRERYLSKRLFMGSGKQQVLDKIKDKVRKINRVLMDVIQPPELKKKYFNEVKSQNPNMTMVELNRQIKNNKMNDRLLDFESTIEDMYNEKPVNSLVMDETIMSGGYEGKPYEKVFFPNLTMYEKKNDNICMALSLGLIINMAKIINQKTAMYKSCFPIERVKCKFDRDTSLQTKVHPALVMYGELFKLRKEQPILKLNFVNRIPTTVLTQLKDYYPDLIKEYLKEEKNNSFNHFTKKRSSSKGKRSSSSKGRHKKKKHY